MASWGASAVPSASAWRLRGQPVVMLAFQGPVWHVGNVPAKVLAFGKAQKREALLDWGGWVSVGSVPFEGGRWRVGVLKDEGVIPVCWLREP